MGYPFFWRQICWNIVPTKSLNRYEYQRLIIKRK
jgi:hypothetical protein